ncbi:class I SAM-dependent methyltransferase [Ruixingdingia sedimenti]|uniref:SAM-dependent methyltransferase n=1 Tax=Ruixingdingia sedimenti TaxID=3073604 RepID=A0ABU1F7C6_9RHOB|nr:SAM-dependent methyltransferase [Xinfangfangia sp. LG-4]MDR5652337.1 SAM-dependent methyltransferase [Xinfangfangia sp. LG-4]
MTPLAALLTRRIAATGPMTLADYMAECLLHPDHGYYTTRPPFGAEGDFTTAPEISQMFGELLGLCLAQAWLDQGRPGAFTLAELGPGRGVLMADVLRATARVPGFHAAARVVLVEASPALRDRQRAAVAPHAVDWADSADALPEAPLFLLANEFFDALPIRQFARAGAGWAETMVGLNADGRLALGRATPLPVAALAGRLADTAPGDVVELCPAAPGVMAAVAGRVARHGGVALAVDYGGWRSRGDTFQALRRHGFADPLAEPGQADLTAHVDFEPLARAAEDAGARALPLVTQGVLLERLGIAARASALAGRLAGDALAAHLAAHRRLTHPEEMGTLFKALAVIPHGAPLPAGFAP